MGRTGGWVAAMVLAACGGGGDGEDGTTSGGATSAGGTTQPTSGPDEPGTSGAATTAMLSTTSTSAGPGETTAGTEGGETGASEGETGEATECADNCHYIRGGANGGGGDWEDALPALPEVLERGHVYFVAAGDYPGYVFDDPEAGDAEIRVLRASAADHGTEVGWAAAYAEGEATFGPLAFISGRYAVDGRAAARSVGAFEGTVVDIAGDAVRFAGFDVDGAFAAQDGLHVGGSCTAMSIAGDDVVVAGNRIHDAADDGVTIGGVARLAFTGNVVHTLYGCGTDGGCGQCYNGHSDGLELFAVVDSEFVGNLIYDMTSTSAVFFGNWADELGMGPEDYCENVLLANNILYSPETGFVAYIEDARGVRLINNVLWGLHMGAYGGLSIGTNVADLDMYNNAILSINYTHIGGMYDPAEHRGDYNLFAYSLGQWQDGPHDVVAVDPLFMGISGGEGPAVDAPTPADFTPQVGSPLRDVGYAGDADIVVPATDFFGAMRDETPNLGAIE